MYVPVVLVRTAEPAHLLTTDTRVLVLPDSPERSAKLVSYELAFYNKFTIKMISCCTDKNSNSKIENVWHYDQSNSIFQFVWKPVGYNLIRALTRNFRQKNTIFNIIHVRNLVIIQQKKRNKNASRDDFVFHFGWD